MNRSLLPAVPIPDEAYAGNLAIVGKTGSGKTYTGKGLIEQVLAANRRTCILDPTGVWWGLRALANGDAAGFPITVFGGSRGDVEIGDSSGAAVAEAIASHNLPAIVDISDMTAAGVVRFATAFFDTLYARNRLPLTLVLDEADVFAPQRPQANETTMLSRVEQIVRRGRVRGFRTWTITQRPASLNKNVLSQADTLIAMKLTSPQDRDAIGAWIEGQADRTAGKQVLSDLPKLPQGEGWVWCPAHDVLRRNLFPAIRTYDSSRTPEEGETLPPVSLAAIDVTAIRDSLAEIEAPVKKAAPVKASGEPLITQADVDAAFRRGLEQGETGLAVVLDAIDMHLATAEASLARARAAARRYAEDAAPAEEEPPPYTTYSVEAIDKRGRVIHSKSPVAVIETEGSLSKVQRAILVTLANYSKGCTKVQLGIVSGYSAGGGSFNAALSYLRAKDFIASRGDRLVITDDGRTAVGPVPQVMTGAAMFDHWRARLSKAEAAILTALVEVRPGGLSKQQIAVRTGYEAGGGSFNAALSKLRTIELISGTRSLMHASEVFAQGGSQ